MHMEAKETLPAASIKVNLPPTLILPTSIAPKTGSKNIHPFILKLFPLHQNPPPEQSGKIITLDTKAHNWGKLTNRQKILGAITGLDIKFNQTPSQHTEPKEYKLDKVKQVALDTEISQMERKGAIAKAREQKGQFISPVFLKEEMEGGEIKYRPIVNLKNLNKFITAKPFKMEDLREVKNSILQNDWMVKIDLSKAFWSVKLSERLRKWIRFRHKDTLYEARSMMFGLTLAPRVFTKIMKIPMSLLRHLNIRIHIYIDDMIILAKEKKDIIQARDTTIYLLEALGFTINHKKSVLDPTRQLIYLGIHINSQTLTLFVPQEKVKKLTKKCTDLITNAQPTLRKLSSTMGALRATSIAFTPAPIQLRNIQQLLKAGLKSTQNYETIITLDKPSRLELKWWIENMNTYNGTPISLIPPELTISTDASLMGWGAHCRGQDAGGQWTQNDLNNYKHINILELEACRKAILTFTRIHKVKSIHLQIDNKCALTYLLKQGGKSNRVMNDIAKEIWQFLIKNKITISAEYIPSQLNIQADRMSRTMDLSEWKLSKRIFKTICNKLGQPQLDLFASQTSHQLDRYISWRPDPESEGADAFQINWTHTFTYAFPPFKMIGRTLCKLRSHRSNMIIITPIWRSQSWYPHLLEMTINHPLLLPNHKDLLTDPTGNRSPLLQQKNFKLAAWLISGNCTKQKAYQQTLQISSHTPEGGELTPIMSQLGNNSQAGVINNKRIPFIAI